jgi:hypothetical protein
VKTVLMFAAVIPALAALIGSASVLVGGALGAHPFWADPRMTVSEAAGLASSGEVVRLVQHEHQDPSRAWPVRAGILGASQNVTPLEAAVAIRRYEMVVVLLRLGAAPRSAAERTSLICRAAANRLDGIVQALLATGDRSDPRADCTDPR